MKANFESLVISRLSQNENICKKSNLLLTCFLINSTPTVLFHLGVEDMMLNIVDYIYTSSNRKLGFVFPTLLQKYHLYDFK